jgi:hypothetical protein
MMQGALVFLLTNLGMPLDEVQRKPGEKKCLASALMKQIR